MQKKYLTVFIATLLAGTALFGSKIDDYVIKAEKSKVTNNPNLKLKKINISHKKKLDKQWTGYVVDVVINVNGSDQRVKDIVYTDGKKFVNNLYDLKTGQDFKDKMSVSLTKEFYNNKFLVYGSKKAKNKMVVFSDPLCPICVQYMPKMLNDVRYKSKNLALYYIPMPLNMHHTAKTIAKAAILAKHDGIKDVDYKIYTGRFSDFFDPYKEKNQQVALDTFNRIMGTKYKLSDLEKKFIKQEMELADKLALKAMVSGTPTVFYNGEKDKTRSKYLKTIKK